MLSENMASLGGEQIISAKDSQDSTSQKDNNRPSSVERKLVRDREEKLRITKERQNEERQRKIEELKAQAEAAQKYREQKEEERRRRIEELRNRDNDRRVQVEERKKAIMEAEKERREYILRKNQERDARLDSKKRNERSSNVFAFGSSTPRLLDPAELGNISPSTYWGHRRSTSITNVAYTGAPLSRRSSERELADGSKKRATSAGGIDRQNDEDTTDSPPISYRSVARRKTDLMPTIPSPRESSFGSKTSLHSHTPRTPGSRSGDVTPGGSINTSRPGSAMSTSTTASGLVQRRSIGPVRKPRPASIAVTGVSLNDEINKHKKEKPPLPKLQSTPKRATNSSNSLSKSVISENGKLSERRSSAKKDAPSPKPRSLMHQSMDSTMLVKTTTTETVVGPGKTEETKVTETVTTIINDTPQTKEEKEARNAEKTEVSNTTVVTETVTVTPIENKEEKQQDQVKEEDIKQIEIVPEEKVDTDTEKDIVVPKESSEPRELSVERQDNEMTASMYARKITTEEQAKAALAEKRKIMREEAERQAEIERQRIEAEEQAELKRQAEEEERQRKFEEETLRLAEEQKHAEEERLLQAIEEAKKREEVERLKREDEEKQKVEREEAEKKAKEEAEKQRLEIAERLKKEEKEREERRKRVEAIMSRTRAKGGNSTPNSTPTKDNDNKTNDKDDKSQEDDEKSSAQEILASTEINENAQSDNSEQDIAECPAPQEEQQQQFSEQCAYEKTVTDKENALIKSFSNMIIDGNTKMYQNFQNPFVQVANGKTLQEQNQSNETVTHPIANGNGHIENLNKNDTNQLVDMSAAITDQLIDFNNESQQITDQVNFNNNSLSSTTTGTTLVTSDSHENKEISLL